MSYLPENPPLVETVEEVVQWVFEQLQQLGKSMQETLTLELRASAAEPERPREGMIVFADGTNWDPGSGAGVYVYRSSGWRRLTESPVTSSSKTIATGAITLSLPYQAIQVIVVDTESAAASDDLDTITGGVFGQILVLKAANSARTVVVKDGTNIKCAGDHSLDNEEDTITLIKDSSTWRELARSNNGA